MRAQTLTCPHTYIRLCTRTRVFLAGPADAENFSLDGFVSCPGVEPAWSSDAHFATSISRLARARRALSFCCRQPRYAEIVPTGREIHYRATRREISYWPRVRRRGERGALSTLAKLGCSSCHTPAHRHRHRPGCAHGPGLPGQPCRLCCVHTIRGEGAGAPGPVFWSPHESCCIATFA